MPTLAPPERRVKVVALLARQRETVLIDQPLDLDTLALLQAASPLSRMFLDGAGMEFRPKAIAVYVDGKRLWCEECPRHGATDAISTTGKADLPTVPFTDAFPEDDDDDGRLAANRAAWETMRNDYSGRDDADEWAAEVIEAAGSLRPKLRPTPPPGPHAPP